MITSLRSLVKKAVKAELLEYAQILDEAQNNSVLDKYLQEINAAHFHSFQSGGKLVRPLLLVLVAGCFGGPRGVSNALSAAAAIECAHTYSLVHDDLPCMDNDALRRGKPTVHTVYGDAKGLLVGDGLLTAAFEILSHSRALDENLHNRSHLILKQIKIFSASISMRGMIWGQWLDISEVEYQDMFSELDAEAQFKLFQTVHKNKTGKLFAACFAIGFLCGIYSNHFSLEEEHIFQIQQKLFDLGLKLGFSFQIIDDILDETQTSEQLGKTACKDLNQDKITAISILGVEKAQTYAEILIKDVLNDLPNILNTTDSESLKPQHEYLDELLQFLKSLSLRQF